MVYGKLIVENMPGSLSQKIIMFQNIGICIGLVVAYNLGIILPDPDDLEANKEDELWRIIYLFPLFIGVFELAVILLVFRQEPIAYCILTG